MDCSQYMVQVHLSLLHWVLQYNATLAVKCVMSINCMTIEVSSVENKLNNGVYS